MNNLTSIPLTLPDDLYRKIKRGAKRTGLSQISVNQGVCERDGTPSTGPGRNDLDGTLKWDEGAANIPNRGAGFGNKRPMDYKPNQLFKREFPPNYQPFKTTKKYKNGLLTVSSGTTLVMGMKRKLLNIHNVEIDSGSEWFVFKKRSQRARKRRLQKHLHIRPPNP